jgi:hypothetical protein
MSSAETNSTNIVKQISLVIAINSKCNAENSEWYSLYLLQSILYVTKHVALLQNCKRHVMLLWLSDLYDNKLFYFYDKTAFLYIKLGLSIFLISS